MMISVLALVVAISGLVLVQGGVGAQGTFNPEVDAWVSDDEHLANADITTTFDVPGTDYNYMVLVSFTPPGFGPAAAGVPIGARVGEISSSATLGLLNDACGAELAPHFDLFWASTDISDTITYDEQFANEPLPNPPYQPGIHDGIHHYPDFLTRMLPGITPVSRMYGYANVSGSDVTINLVVLEAGALGHPAAWGQPSMSVLNDMGDPGAVPAPNPITDFCTPLETTTVVFGLSEDNLDTPGEDEAGYEMRSNPAYGGTYTVRWYTESMPDADGDGFENYGDTCPFDVNVDPSFKVVPGHPDNDGIDGACELGDGATPGINCWTGAPGLPDFTDCDGDGFQNRGDNCPLVANPGQADVDTDDIGDACDDRGNGPNVPDGVPIELELEVDVDISGPSPGEDSDGDGYDDATEANLGSCPDDPCSDEDFYSDTEAADSTPEDASIAGSCSDGQDNDLDGYVDDVDGGCGDDTDGDGVSDDGEDDLGSDPEDADSTPEDASVCDVCTDGVDNDGDGDTDAADEGCAVEAETPTVEAETPTPTVAETPTPTVEAEYCSPVFPGTYNGLVRVDGQPAASGYEVTASIDGVQWGSALVSGGRYAMDIPDHMPTEPPCFEGGTITFALDAMECTPTADWASGIHTVDLSCAPAAPPVTPTPEVTPTPTITPTTVPPTGAGGLSGSGPGLPLWAMALASWAGLAIVAGLGTLVAAKRR